MNGLFDWRNRILNLMFLDGDGGSGGGTAGDGGDGGEPPEDNPPKTFTQDELNSILASEKRKNLSSVYKELGFEKPEDAKAFVEKYREEEQNKKDDLTKSNEKVTELEQAKEAEAKRAREAEYKFKVIESGCDVKNAADVVALAMSKMSDDKDFETALKEVKENYPSMFDSSNGGSGTGTGGNPPRQKGKGKELSGIGKRLAEQRKSSSAKKDNSFFK